MGARPIAVLDALRFGDPADARTRHLVDGVVRGVGGYGNCVGVPTVGGELVFDPSYAGNPLVNVMAIGLLEERLLTLATAGRPGNLVVLYGSATGRDGIGGASVLASATFTDDDPSKRPSVQVGDPFAEKLLIEASLELIERGLVEGLQDLGAGGITCATSETADRAGTGILVDLDAIPRREPGLEPFEVMISESQERMCAAVRPERWAGGPRGLRALGPAGRDHRPGHRRRRHRGRRGRPRRDGRPRPAPASWPGPGRALTSDAIVHERVAGAADPPPRRAGARCARVEPSDRLPERGMDPGAVLVALLGSAEPGLAPRRLPPVRLDGRRRHRRRPGPRRRRPAREGDDARRSSPRPTATSRSARSTRGWAPRCRSRRRPATSRSPGARPLGVTNCLNYGDPTRPEAFWQLTEGVRGLADACRALGLPVTGGNVSLYNESPGRRDRPDARDRRGRPARRRRDARRAGLRARPATRSCSSARRRPGLAGSAYAALAGGAVGGRPARCSTSRARRPSRRFIREAIARGLVASAQDVSGGGLAVALAECAMWGGLGRDRARAGRRTRRRSTCSARVRRGSS